MSTPVDPVEPVPQTAEPLPADVPQPIPDGAPTDVDIRDLATTLQRMADLGFDAPTFKKAVVTAVNYTANPPILDVQMSGDTTVTVSGVVFLDSYSPVAGDTVLIAKQGTDIFAFGQIVDGTQGGAPQGWATLAGSVEYRLVVDNGDQKVQLKGSGTFAGTFGTMPVGFRPSVTRVFNIARNGDAVAMLCTVNTSGVVTLSGLPNLSSTPTTSSDSHSHTGTSHSHGIGHTHGGTTDLRLCGYLSQAGSDLCHSHLISSGLPSSGNSATSGTGSTSSDAHTHTVSVTVVPTNPTTVWFDNVEYFL